MLWNSQIKLLHFDLPARVLQTHDRSAMLPDGPHVSTCLLDVDTTLLQTELLWLGCFRLLQEGLRRELRRSECLRQQLRSGVRCSRSLRPSVCRSCGLCSGLCGTRRVRSGLCGSGCGLCEQLCSELCRSLRQRLWQQRLRSELRRSLWPESLLCSRCLWS